MWYTQNIIAEMVKQNGYNFSIPPSLDGLYGSLGIQDVIKIHHE